jgi:hypothetical protein
VAIHTRILTKVELPREIEVEIQDTVRGEKTRRKVLLADCMARLAKLGPVDLDNIDPADLLSMALAIAKHVAIDDYLMSIGVDPHKDVSPLDET